mmetsp:Transcript_20235/g.81379  ORF Transcript_20235/g.81379 Transcript_20235/m.81379 type:complete len:793 (-) Transcript_20235:3330-5708(-)|eukprot:CAMPEP_0113962290 /NCGR_PEP_ID=MMETSP0011_2-20120614/5829_1 /TAXON_ID=101924 /ORGANISM="Rhodosorus marinus" /LENGTH=792 /DNA_ID=CAMNT_0000974119 /DNA_START=40 /DNA_END=2418 /DNA_ORIENTATION=+ /assembly_acc=CAM_ASM_000156
MGKNRDTHDPETVLPEAISEELENFNAKKTNGSTEREPKHLVSFGTGRKQLRREKREQKKKNKMLALKDWRERRQQKRPRSTRVEETKASVDVEDDSGKKKRKSKKKEKRSRIEEEEEGVVGEEQQVMDPDQAEEERLQKLLFNSSKKQKKGTSFDWDLEFGSDNDEDGLKYLLEGLNVLTKSAKKAKRKNTVLDFEEEEFDEEEPDDDHFRSRERTEDPGDDRAGVGPEEVLSRGEETAGLLNGSERDERSFSYAEDVNPGSMDKVRDRENSKSNTLKYVPPNRRSGVEPGTSKQLLERRLRSSFNRLTNENSQKLIQEISTLLDAALEKGLSWNEVVNLLAEVVLSSVRDGSGVGRINPFVAAHAGAVIYLHVNSNDAFGAKMVAHAARAWRRAVAAKNRASFGLQAVLVELFHGNLLPSTFLFEVIEQLILELDEQKIELLLLLIRSTGPALRHSDPGALMDIVNRVKDAAEVLDLNVLEDRSRVQVLLDLVYDVKNHKTEETRSNIRFVLPWMKGILQELSPLQVQLSDLYDDEFVSTRWWRANEINRRNIENQKANEAGKERTGNGGAALAKQLGFNTDFRREIFTAISTSVDVKDAVQRLSKLKLRKQRYDDCAHVIIHCCASESQYNKFYSLLARRVCRDDRDMLYAFRHGFGNAFRVMEEGSDGCKPTSTYLRNLSQMLGYLWGLGILDLGVLKRAPDLTDCSDESVTFFKLAFESALAPGGGGQMTNAFQQLATGDGFKHRDSIRLPLILFLRAHFENSKDVAMETRRRVRHLIGILTSAEDN